MRERGDEHLPTCTHPATARYLCGAALQHVKSMSFPLPVTTTRDSLSQTESFYGQTLRAPALLLFCHRTLDVFFYYRQRRKLYRQSPAHPPFPGCAVRLSDKLWQISNRHYL